MQQVKGKRVAKALARANTRPMKIVNRLLENAGRLCLHVMMLAESAQIAVETLDSLLVGLDAFSFQSVIELEHS